MLNGQFPERVEPVFAIIEMYEIQAGWQLRDRKVGGSGAGVQGPGPICGHAAFQRALAGYVRNGLQGIRIHRTGIPEAVLQIQGVQRFLYGTKIIPIPPAQTPPTYTGSVPARARSLGRG